MICTDCANAADGQLVRAAHCLATGSPGSGCDCQHRTDRYRQRPAAIVLPGVPIDSAMPSVTAALRVIARAGRQIDTRRSQR